MAWYDLLITLYSDAVPLVRTALVVIILALIFTFLVKLVKRKLLKRASTKKQKSNIEIFSSLITYLAISILVIVAIFTYSGSWTGLGLTVGLVSAALGFALQKPITGIAAWMVIVIRRPFDIGDRVIIGKVKGDVVDITLTHVYIDEAGGTVNSEENSGRIVMVPNNLLFDLTITNYTQQHDYILDEVVTSVTYESDLDKAMSIIQFAAKKYTQEYCDAVKYVEEPYTRIRFGDSCVEVYVRYYVPARKRQMTLSFISKEIYDQFRKHDDVEIAYPHLEVLHRKK